MYTYYVEFGGPIDDYAEALSCSFGMGSSRTAGGAGHVAQRNAFQFTKDRDSLSHAIFQHSMAGTVFGTVWVEMYQDDDDYPKLTYTLSGVVITSLTVSKSGRESIGLDFKSVSHS